MATFTSAESKAVELSSLTTELADPRLAELDKLSTIERLRLMNTEDKTAAEAVEKVLDDVAAAIELIVSSLRRGGRLIYVGAGTSGRLGILDASECPPTFGTDPKSVSAIIAGGRGAMFEAVEGAEDDIDAGRIAIAETQVTEVDTVVGISASGQAPYVVGALQEARERRASTIAVVNNRPCKMEELVSVTIAPIVGPEFIAGSTRLKAGTSQKMVLNMLTTNAMIEIGKTYGNRMVDVRATNAKLRARALRMTSEIAGASLEAAEAALNAAGGSVKLAILMIKSGQDSLAASDLLQINHGFLRAALESAAKFPLS